MLGTTRRTKFLGGAIAVAMGILALPAASMGATSFGSALTDEPNGSLNSPAAQCPTMGTACTRVGNVFPSQGDNQTQRSPIDGVVVAFRIRSNTPDQITFRVAKLETQLNTAFATTSGNGPSVTLAGTGAIEQFAARTPVAAGEAVAIDSVQTTALYGNSGGKRQYQYSPVLTAGQGPRAATDTEDEEILVQAVVEADADKDGFGDESQDGCLNNPAGGACPVEPVQQPRDTTAPVVSSLAFAPANFRAANVGATIKRAPIGSRVFYRLSEAAGVTLRIEKAVSGRRSGRSCKPVTRRNRLARKCTRLVMQRGVTTRSQQAGLQTVKLTGRLNGRKLAVGSYRLVIQAKDAAGNVSKVKRGTFRIVK